MRILYFYQYFSTSEGAWGTRVYEFAKNWVKAGHQVTVVTSVYAKSDLKARHLIEEKQVEGIRVLVINIHIDNRQTILRRISSFVQYAFVSSWYALTEPADIVVASSGPITVGIPGLVARWIRRRKLVFEARDLWPEGAVRMGMIRNRLLIRLSWYFESVCYRNAALIVGLSPGIAADIKRRFPACRVESVTNAANISLFAAPSERAPSVPGPYAIYFGNLGEVNHSAFLLDAAAVLIRRNRLDIKLVLIGEGQLKQALLERIDREKLTNVMVLDLMPKTKLVSFIQHALVSLIPLKPLEIFDTSSPNKLFESLAAGVPVIQTTQGWIKSFVAEQRIGYTIDGNHPEELAEKLIYLLDHPEEAVSMGIRSREVAMQYFDKDVLAQRMLNLMVQTHEQ